MVDNDCIGIWNIQSRFDNSGGNQHIEFAVDKIHHQFFEFLTVHLPVTNNSANARHQLADHRFDLKDICNAVMDEKNLSFARHFVLNCFSDNFLAESVQLGGNRISVGWRCLYNR